MRRAKRSSFYHLHVHRLNRNSFWHTSGVIVKDRLVFVPFLENIDDLSIIIDRVWMFPEGPQ
jgi:hypothetical protein